MNFNMKSIVQKLGLALLTSSLFCGFSTANAASNWDNNDHGDDYITVYQHCGYQGGSKRLAVGKYKRVQDEGIPNDAISSIRIPQGMSVKAYKHKKFDGRSQTFNSSVKCLNSGLNDQITSLKVQRARGSIDTGGNWAGSGGNWAGSGGNWSGSGGNSCATYSVTASGGEGGFRFTHDPQSFQRIGGRAISGRICNRNNVQVELSKTNPATSVVLDVNGNRYRFGQGDSGDKFENSWYRRYFTIRLK